MLDLQSATERALQSMPQRAEAYRRRARSDGTLLAYRRDWSYFSAWCDDHGLPPRPSPPAVVAEYLSQIADEGLSVSTVRRRAAAIGMYHRAAHIDPPPTKHGDVVDTLDGIARAKGRPAHKKDALTGREIVQLIEATPRTLIGLRDRAALLVGLIGAFRRSEIVSIDIEDIERATGGLIVTLKRSKTDQDGKGYEKPVPKFPPPICPVTALDRWLDASHITGGAVFRPIDRHGHVRSSRLTDHSVAVLIKAACARAGMDPRRYAGHSLRAGFATSSAAGGAASLLIRDQTGHKSDRMLAEYVRRGTMFQDHAAYYIEWGLTDGDHRATETPPGRA